MTAARKPRRRKGAITDVIPSGGYQDPKAYAGMCNTQSIYRAPVRCMYPGELLQHLRYFLHPRWISIGVACSTVVNNQRRSETIFGSCGTVWVANAHEMRDLFVVPCDCLPYASIRTATWNEQRTRWEDGEIVRGWRTTLAQLCASTYLKPDPELSWLVGEDTFKLFPRAARM